MRVSWSIELNRIKFLYSMVSLMFFRRLSSFETRFGSTFRYASIHTSSSHLGSLLRAGGNMLFSTLPGNRTTSNSLIGSRENSISRAGTLRTKLVKRGKTNAKITSNNSFNNKDAQLQRAEYDGQKRAGDSLFDTSLSSNPTTFEDLGMSHALIVAMRNLGFNSPTQIQQLSFLKIAGGSDTILGAETGSGKTLAYMLPLLDWIIKQQSQSAGEQIGFTRLFPSCIVLVPNKDLCRQVEQMTKSLITQSALSAYNISAVARTDVFEYWPYRDETCPSILICTPRVISQFSSGLYVGEDSMFSSVKHLVLDEADMLLDGSYQGDIEKILDTMKLVRRRLIREGKLQVHERITQLTLSAATLPWCGKKSVAANIEKMFPNAISISTNHLHDHHPSIKQRFVQIEEEKDTPLVYDSFPSENLLRRLLSDLEIFDQQGSSGGLATMIFLNTAKHAVAVGEALSKKGVSCVQYHNLLHSSEKEENMQRFRQGAERVMVCTDSAARGFDIPHVRHVIQAEFALNVVQHLHRIGRASRAGKAGEAISYYTKSALPLVRSILNEGSLMDDSQDKSVVDAIGETLYTAGAAAASSGKQSIERSFSRRRGFRRKLKRSAESENNW